MSDSRSTPIAAPARLDRRQLLLLASAAAVTLGARAEAYPSRAVRLVAPFSPGQGVDLLARALASELHKATGQPFAVDNRPGGGTVLGTSAAAAAAPDGYTLLAVGNSFAVNPGLHARLPYDSKRDFTPISLLAGTPHVLVAKPQLQARTLAEVIAAAKASPGTMNYASSGNGTAPHLAGEQFNQRAQVRLTHVPYKGQGPTVTALMSGEVDLMFANLLDVLPYVQSRKMQAIAISAPRRDPLIADVPTMGEAGLPGFESSSWYGLMARAGTPGDIVERLNTLVTGALGSPGLGRQYAGKGLNLTPCATQEFARFLGQEYVKYAEIVKFAGIKLE